MLHGARCQIRVDVSIKSSTSIVDVHKVVFFNSYEWILSRKLTLI